MASYRRRLETDLDEWIAAGLVPDENRLLILASVEEERRLDAATALAAIGAFLAGAAVIAFVAANWSEIPRFARFAVILIAFLASALSGAWAAGRGRELTKNILLSISALIFAAAIGLTGQIFDIAGQPATALRGAGVGALILGVAGRSPWAAAAGVLLMTGSDAFGLRPTWNTEPLGWAIFAAPVAAILAMAWRSRALAHVAGIAALAAVFSLPWDAGESARLRFLVASMVFAVLATCARVSRPYIYAVSAEFFGWCVLGLLAYFGAAGMGVKDFEVIHAIAWLVLSAAVAAIGRQDGHAPVTGIGVFSLIAAGMVLSLDLGVDLRTSAAVFAGCGIAALMMSLALRRRGRL